MKLEFKDDVVKIVGGNNNKIFNKDSLMELKDSIEEAESKGLVIDTNDSVLEFSRVFKRPFSEWAEVKEFLDDLILNTEKVEDWRTKLKKADSELDKLTPEKKIFSSDDSFKEEEYQED